MKTKKILAGALSMILLILLVYSIFNRVGDIRLLIMLGTGAALGLAYAAIGKLPDWIHRFSGDTIVEDDAPSNIPPRVYIPILLGVILLACIVLLIVIYML